MTKPSPPFKIGDIVEIIAGEPNVQHSWGLIGVVKRVDVDNRYIYANAIVKPEHWKFHDWCCPWTAVRLLGSSDDNA